MTVTLTEIREARFEDREMYGMASMCRIDYKYEVHTESGIRTFGNQASAEAYIKYLQEQKNDYLKVVKEIEI